LKNLNSVCFKYILDYINAIGQKRKTINNKNRQSGDGNLNKPQFIRMRVQTRRLRVNGYDFCLLDFRQIRYYIVFVQDKDIFHI